MAEQDHERKRSEIDCTYDLIKHVIFRKILFLKTKLTLSIPEEKIKKIKLYTKANGISISKFLEQRIDIVTTPKENLKRKI